MTGHNDGDGIAATGAADGAVPAANFSGDLAIGFDLAIGDFEHMRPNPFVKWRALGGQRQIEAAQVAIKISTELFLGFKQKRCFLSAW